MSLAKLPSINPALPSPSTGQAPSSLLGGKIVERRSTLHSLTGHNVHASWWMHDYIDEVFDRQWTPFALSRRTSADAFFHPHLNIKSSQGTQGKKSLR